jgi:hypothetical protein
MAVPAQVLNLLAQQSDGNILLTWNGVLGATSYQIQRSTDGVNFTSLNTSTTASYLDSLPGVGIQYYYQVAGINISGTGAYSSIVSMVAAPPSEMSLGELRFRAQQCADMVNSQFVTVDEWNAFARIAMYELYDLLIDTYEDYGVAPPILIPTNSTTFQFPLPDGVSNYLGGTYGGNSGAPAAAYYKLLGVDLQVNSSTVTPSWVTLNKYNFIDRNQFIYPNSTSTIYGVYNMRYRVMGGNIQFIPTPAGNQIVRLWYAPRLKGLLQDTDLTTIGVSGWLRYVIVRMAKYALDKEESDTTVQTQEIAFLKTRIEQAASNRDASMPDTISNTRRNAGYGGMDGTGMSGGSNAGW